MCEVTGISVLLHLYSKVKTRDVSLFPTHQFQNSLSIDHLALVKKRKRCEMLPPDGSVQAARFPTERQSLLLQGPFLERNSVEVKCASSSHIPTDVSSKRLLRRGNPVVFPATFTGSRTPPPPSPLQRIVS